MRNSTFRPTTATDRGAPLGEAVGGVYALLANAFAYPDPAWAATFRRESRWEELRVRVAVDAGLAMAVTRVERRLRRPSRRSASPPAPAGDAPAGGSLAQLQDDYTRLFSHAVRGLCPPYELEYGRRDILQQSPQLADIGGFYAAFGLTQADGSRERLDHVTVECDFLARLSWCEVEASNAEDDEPATVVRDAHRAFLEHHLGRWAPAFARQVREADPEGFYGAAAELLAVVIEFDARRLGLVLGPTLLPLCPDVPEAAAEFECGGDGRSGQQRLVPLEIEPKR